MMVPTHLLAEQHGLTLTTLLGPTGVAPLLLTGSLSARERKALAAKGEAPDVLLMTATPIPRSLALTLYGDLDLSVLDERPPGRQPVMTALRYESARERVLAFLRRELEQGRQ